MQWQFFASHEASVHDFSRQTQFSPFPLPDCLNASGMEQTTNDTTDNRTIIVNFIVKNIWNFLLRLQMKNDNVERKLDTLNKNQK